MWVRAFCLFVAVFYFNAAGAADCNYSEQGNFLSRVVAIESAGGPVYRNAKGAQGASDMPSPLELREKEVLLVFDQGPNPAYTRYILEDLDHHCAKAVFFFAGNAAMANPDLVRDAARRGHTLAAGPWSTAPNLASLPSEGAQAEIEKGFAAVAKASGSDVAPFFSAPGQNLPPATLDYLKERGVSLWPVDIDSGDLEPGLTASKFANRTLERVYQAGKGIIEFHDTRKVTVDALDSILTNLKANGFKLVQILPAETFTPKEEYKDNPAKAPGTIAASPTSGAFIDEAKRQVRAAETERAQRRERQVTAERRDRQEAAERRERAEGAERRARQEAAERRARARYAERMEHRSAAQRQEAEERQEAGERQEAMERREVAMRRAQARNAGRLERRTAQLRQEAAIRRARQEAAERRAQERSSDRTERRRTAQRPD